MLIDIHRHTATPGNADIVLRNLFHTEINEIESGKYYSVGLHPWHLKPGSFDTDFQEMVNAFKQKEVVAIGETGLDKAIDTDINLQLKSFENHLHYAIELDKVIIIHCVRAYNELISIRKNCHHKQPWIFHWYNASPQIGKELIKKNCYLSFGHMLFNETSKAFKTFLNIPLSNVFFETDDANITITDVYKKAADIRKIKVNNLVEQIKTNFQNCFNIEL